MARQHEIVQELLATEYMDVCIMILDDKKFGTLLGELLKLIKVAEEDKDKARELFMQCDQMVDDLREKLEKRTPEGLKHTLPSATRVCWRNVQGVACKCQRCVPVFCDNADGET
jgi:hypothetical protein